jgi:hypothetical protein
MQTEIQTERVHRTWLDKVLLWRRAFQTRIYDQQREAIGRGPTAEASRKAALEKWVTGGQAEYEATSE